MARRAKINSDDQNPQRPVASTAEGRENQLVSYAMDLAEKQLLDGTASSQVITYYLKAGSVREELERQRLYYENLLLQEKRKQLESQAKTEVMYEQAIRAMRAYQGIEDEVEEDTDDPDLY